MFKEKRCQLPIDDENFAKQNDCSVLAATAAAGPSDGQSGPLQEELAHSPPVVVQRPDHSFQRLDSAGTSFLSCVTNQCFGRARIGNGLERFHVIAQLEPTLESRELFSLPAIASVFSKQRNFPALS